jgi:CheY-like chemotaxis protein
MDKIFLNTQSPMRVDRASRKPSRLTFYLPRLDHRPLFLVSKLTPPTAMVRTSKQDEAISEGKTPTTKVVTAKQASQHTTKQDTAAALEGDTAPLDMKFTFRNNANNKQVSFNDVILIDLAHPSMTGKDGIAMCAETRRKAHIAKVPEEYGTLRFTNIYVEWKAGDKEELIEITPAISERFAAIHNCRGLAVTAKIEVVCTVW